MSKKIRFSDFVREVTISQHEISFNDLTTKPSKANRLKSLFKPKKIQLRPMDAYRLLKPYVSVRFTDQFKAVVPLAIYLILFQMIILRQSVEDSGMITSGLFAVMIGLMFFMEGLKLGLMPFGEAIGSSLPKKSPLWVVLLISFLLGVGVTFAEPAIGALKTAGSIVDVTKAPYLYALLNQYADTLVLIIGAGVGIAAIIGTLRFIYGWSLKPIIYFSMVPTLGLTAYFMGKPELQKVLGLAWDCGAVTTGPVTVPLVLSLGIGVAASAGKGDSTLSGFGIVTLASIFPILGAMILVLYVSQVIDPETIIAQAQLISSQNSNLTTQWWQKTPGEEIILGLRAIVPLVLFLFLVLKMILKEKLSEAGVVVYGIVLAVIGMVVFNLGLTYGLAKLGSQAGGLVPGAFTNINNISGSPLYTHELGLFIAFFFAWFLGFGATLAEPALNALGMTVQTLTNGAFKKSLLMHAVSIGVATGISLGILKIIFEWQLAYLLLPLYFVGIILTFVSSEEFVNVAWDSAGVTTGPVTVPLVLAMGLGLGSAVSAVEGFGILSMASICPIISVLICGIYIQSKEKQKNKKDIKEADVVKIKGAAI